MNTHYRTFVLSLLGILLASAHPAVAQVPSTLLHSLFNPGTNAQAFAQQGYSVAVDGNITAVGAPYDDTGGFDSGVVKVYDAKTGALLHTLVNPSSKPQDFFGSSVAISGTRLVVGGPPAEPSYSRPGVAYVYDLAASTPTVPLLMLTHPNPTAADRFGSAVAISGERVVIGAFWDDTGGTDAGSAFVYDLASATPSVPVLTLTNPTPSAGEAFARAVAISGTRVLIGVYGDDTGGEDAGSAYVYDVSGVTPAVPVLTLTNPAPAAFDQFALSVSISGTRVVVGARYDDTAGNQTGSAYVYDLDSAAPTVPVATLTNPSPRAEENFGFSVGIDGTRVVVGALGDNTGALAAGSAYVYDLANAAPTVPVTTLTNPIPAAGDYFGFSVAISGSRVVAGAPNDDAGATDAGSAYVYDLAGATPTVPVATLNQPSLTIENRFGNSVAISGTFLVAGASGDDTGATDAGSVYVYDSASATPTLPVLTLTNSSPRFEDRFGNAVAISGTWIVVGAYQDDNGANNAGSAYVYDLACSAPTVAIFTLTNPSPAALDQFGISVAISGTRVVVGASYDDAGANDAGTAYVYDLSSATPMVPMVTFTNPAPAGGDYFGDAVAISGARVVVGAPQGFNGQGKVYVFDLTNAPPTVAMELSANPFPTNGRFGSAVAISGPYVVVGAQQARRPDDTGRAFVYDLYGATPSTPILTLDNPTPQKGDNFGRPVAISGTRVLIGARGDNTSAEDSGSVYLYEITSASPAVPVATLNNPTPAMDDFFGSAIGIDGTTIVVGAFQDDTNGENRGTAYIFGLRPALGIVPAAPGLATLSWMPATSSGFVLQYADILSPTNWINAPSGAANPVSIAVTNAVRFHRLIQP